MKCFLFAAALLFAGIAAHAAESGFTLRATDLKTQPFSDAATLITLPEKTPVTITTRQSAWMQIRTRDGKSGWVRMLSVRLGDPNQKPGGGNILAAIGIGSRPRPQTSATVTTGVRGFSEEELKEAKPNPVEVDKMEGFAADPAQLPAFAQNGKLAARPVPYFAEDGESLEKR
jgi:hypothetical protein